MKVDFWIKIKVRESKWGPQPRGFEPNGVPQCTINKPHVNQDEFAFKIKFEVPDSYFRTPELAINIAMPELDGKCEINSTMQENLSQIIQEQLGVKAHLSICGGNDE